MPKPLDPLVKAHRELERLKLDNGNLRSLNKKLLRRGGGFDDFLEEFKTAIKEDSKFKFVYTPSSKILTPGNPNHHETAVVLCSDLHLNEVVSPAETLGINIYNPMVAANRLWYHCQKVKSILKLHMSLYTIDKIWLAFLGDMLHGTIHPEQLITNAMPDPPSVVLGSRLLHIFIRELLSIGLPLEVTAVHGNHPRTTVRMPTKAQATTNLDWLLYEYLADGFRDLPDEVFDMDICYAQMGMKELYKHKFRYEHGMDVGNGHEEAYEDRIRALFDDPIYRDATGMKGSSFSMLLYGDTHKAKLLERSVANGSYTGQNELGMSWRLKPIKPNQIMFGVCKDHVRTWDYMIDMSKVRSEKVENPMSEYAAHFLKRVGARKA